MGYWPARDARARSWSATAWWRGNTGQRPLMVSARCASSTSTTVCSRATHDLDGVFGLGGIGRSYASATARSSATTAGLQASGAAAPSCHSGTMRSPETAPTERPSQPSHAFQIAVREHAPPVSCWRWTDRSLPRLARLLAVLSRHRSLQRCVGAIPAGKHVSMHARALGRSVSSTGITAATGRRADRLPRAGPSSLLLAPFRAGRHPAAAPRGALREESAAP